MGIKFNIDVANASSDEAGIIALEKAEAVEKLEAVCVEKGIEIKYLDYPLKKCIVYFKEIKLLLMASNFKQSHISAIIEII